jgi:hypothetical protein
MTTQSHDSEQAKALARVRKMLNLANNAAATEGERDTAMRQVYTILAKYNLSMADAEASGEAKEEQRGDEAYDAGSMGHAWARTIAHGIAQLFFCKYYFSSWRVRTTQRIRHHFIGRLSNAATASEMTKYVVASVAKEAARRRREAFLDGRWERDFCKGAASRIWRRCEELRQQAELEAKGVSSGRELVLASLYRRELTANEDWLAAQGVSLRTGKDRQRGAGRDAYNAGSEFGKSVSLNRQLSGGAGRGTKLIGQ